MRGITGSVAGVVGSASVPVIPGSVSGSVDLASVPGIASLVSGVAGLALCLCSLVQCLA